MSAERILVPVATSSTIRQTVEYAVETAIGSGEGSYLRFVYVYPAEYTTADTAPDREHNPVGDVSDEILNRVEVWANEDLADRDVDVTIETASLGADKYLFSPEDVALEIANDCVAHGIDRIILDPEYAPAIGAPLLRPLEYELARFDSFLIDEAPVTRPTRRAPLLARTSELQIGALFAISFLFYQVLGGTLDLFDIVTGAVAGLIVAVGLSRVTFGTDPTGESLARVGRMGIYVPYLLFEIIRANIAVAAVILNPKLPIEPRMTRIRPAVWGSLPVTTLANSITLTPGTLTVRVEGRVLKVHTLIPDAREDLFDGALERAVRFVFYGRSAMSISSLREREAATLLPSPSADEDNVSNDNDAGSSDETGVETPSDDDTVGEHDEGGDQQ